MSLVSALIVIFRTVLVNVFPFDFEMFKGIFCVWNVSEEDLGYGVIYLSQVEVYHLKMSVPYRLVICIYGIDVSFTKLS